MAISAEQLNIILSAKDKEFTRAMDRSQKRVERFAKTSNKNLSSTSKAFSKLGSAVKIAAAAFSATAVVSGIKAVTQKLDDIGKTADQIGITTDALQELRTVAESSGVTSDELDKSIEKLGKGLAEAAMGLGTAKDGLKTLGLNARDLIDMGLEDALGVIATELNKLPNPMEKTAAATQLFGRSGAPMINLLREGADGMAQMRKEARELGVVIDEDLIRSAEAAQDQLDLMSRVIDANLSSALINLAPLIVGTTEKIAGLAARAGDVISKVNELREQGVGATTTNYRFVKSLVDQGVAAGYVEEELQAMFKAYDALKSARLSGDGSVPGLIDESVIENYNSAADALALALSAGPNRKFDENAEAARELETAAQNALSIAFRQTEEVREQARLRGISAEAAERERIEAEKQALITSITAPYKKDGTLQDRPMFVQEAKRLGEAYEAAAIAASRILNPVKAATAATKDLRSAAELAREAYVNMLKKMIEVSPLLQQLGFDAETLENTMIMVESSMEQAFMSMVDGTMSAKDAFKSMAADIIKELYRVLVVQQMVGSFTSGGGGILGSIFGAMSGGGGGGGKASGGAVQAGQPYVTGEHGRELFVPSSAGRVLSVSQSKAAAGGGGGGVTINQTINVSTGVQQTVRAEIKSLMPQIADSAKSAVVDARLRGGSYGRAFS